METADQSTLKAQDYQVSYDVTLTTYTPTSNNTLSVDTPIAIVVTGKCGC